MNKIKYIFFVFLLISLQVFSAPFINSYPYEAGEYQLTEFIITISGETPFTVPATLLENGDVMLKYDFNREQIKGKEIVIQAKNNWGISSPIFVQVYSYDKFLSLSPIIKCVYRNRGRDTNCSSK